MSQLPTFKSLAAAHAQRESAYLPEAVTYNVDELPRGRVKCPRRKCSGFAWAEERRRHP